MRSKKARRLIEKATMKNSDRVVVISVLKKKGATQKRLRKALKAYKKELMK